MLEAKLELLKTMCDGMKESSTVVELAKEMQDYETLMLPHLLQEEEECLPLMRAYFTHVEIAPKVQEIIDNGPKVRYCFHHRLVVVKRRHLQNQNKHLKLVLVVAVYCWLRPLG